MIFKAPLSSGSSFTFTVVSYLHKEVPPACVLSVCFAFVKAFLWPKCESMVPALRLSPRGPPIRDRKKVVQKGEILEGSVTRLGRGIVGMERL
jgi:hypothetical protein